MLPHTIRAVAFDAVGTVILPDPSAPFVYANAARRYGIATSPSDVLTRFCTAYQLEEGSDRAAGWVTSEARERNRWQRIVAATLPGSPPECFAKLFEHFARPEAWRVPVDAAGVFASLAARGLKLGLASNYDSRLRSVLAGLPLLRPLAARVIVSADLGWRKPAREFFAAVADAMGEPPERIAFVGDDRTNDYDAAAAAGMFAVLLDPNKMSSASRQIQTLAGLLE
ncbi:MAG TPA: HAD-IA family hydrolase [Fimbriiglobus sp.]|jgi:putative hydrolase of the HAD superfamily